MNSKENYLIVLSYDAFSQDNWEHARKQPNLAKLIENGAATTNLKSVYPTLTYVIHSSYVTGLYPKNHGVHHNNPFQPFEPEKDQAWHWFRNDIQGDTIYEAARRHGLITAGILWPVTGKAKIHYNIPEIRAIKNENQALKILKNGSPFFSIGMELKYGKVRKGIAQPYLDDFITKVTVETIKKKKPNLMLVHLIDLDDSKHLYGTKDPYIETVIERMDGRIGEIIQAVEDAGILKQTTFIIVGDHSQLDVQYMVHLNHLLKEHGLIYKGNGEMKWKAYLQSAGGAAYLHAKDKASEQQAVELLKQSLANNQYGIEAIYDRTQLDELHANQDFSYMLEAKIGYAFDDAYDKDIIVDLQAQGKKYATHGYNPNKPGYTSNLIVAGPEIINGLELTDVEVIDIAPTIARILNIEFNACDGRELSEMFK